MYVSKQKTQNIREKGNNNRGEIQFYKRNITGNLNFHVHNTNLNLNNLDITAVTRYNSKSLNENKRRPNLSQE